jgi:hypothetical protein
MADKKPDLDAATVRILKRMLAMPPKHHDDMKVGRPKAKKRAATKGRAASSKPRTASKTADG